MTYPALITQHSPVAASGSGLCVGCSSSSARTGVTDDWVSGESKVEGVEPTAVQTAAVNVRCQRHN